MAVIPFFSVIVHISYIASTINKVADLLEWYSYILVSSLS